LEHAIKLSRLDYHKLIFQSDTGLQSTRHTVNSSQAKIGLNRKWVKSSQSTRHNRKI